MKVHPLKKILSYFFPVKIRKGFSKENPLLELFLYKDQFQLATWDALYSDGTRYQPLLQGLKKIKRELYKVNNVLVLGAGLGSAVSILDKMNFQPEITLVDYDETILNWADELMNYDEREKIKIVCEHAEEFLEKNKERFDLIVVDIFKGRVVPDFVSQNSFLLLCRNSLLQNGNLIVNYMVNSLKEWETFCRNFKTIFPDVQIIEIGINRVLIAKV